MSAGATAAAAATVARGAEAMRARLARAGVTVPRAESVVVDLASDGPAGPPLGRAHVAIAVEEAARVVAGLGAAMAVSRARSGVIAVASKRAEAALAREVARLADALTDGNAAGGGAAGLHTGEPMALHGVAIVRVPARHPTHGLEADLGRRYAWVLDGEQLLDLESIALDRARAPRRVTVAGVVRRPGVLTFHGPAPTVEELVARAGGATDLAWVPLDGGQLVDRACAVGTPLLLVLPQEHPLVAKARTPVGEWLRRAASVCEGCRACSDACPIHLAGGRLAPHDVVATLVTQRDVGTRLGDAADCLACGACDAACPSALSPGALVGAVRAKLPSPVERAPHERVYTLHPDRDARRLTPRRVAARLGLADYWLDEDDPPPGP